MTNRHTLLAYWSVRQKLNRVSSIQCSCVALYAPLRVIHCIYCPRYETTATFNFRDPEMLSCRNLALLWMKWQITESTTATTQHNGTVRTCAIGTGASSWHWRPSPALYLRLLNHFHGSTTSPTPYSTSSSSSSSSTTVGSMPVGVWRHSYYRCPPLPI